MKKVYKVPSISVLKVDKSICVATDSGGGGFGGGGGKPTKPGKNKSASLSAENSDDYVNTFEDNPF